MISADYIIHLLLDELYSVDLENRRVKKSVGTAFKFFSVSSNIDAVNYHHLFGWW